MSLKELENLLTNGLFIELTDDYPFKDVDLWFKNEEEKYEFIGEKGEKLNPSTRGTDINLYGKMLDRMNYIADPSTRPVEVDIVFSEVNPVDDFDVNNLNFSIVNNKWCIGVNDAKFTAINLI